MTSGALEQRFSKPALYLRSHRLRITAWIAAPEGLLVLIHVIPHLAIYLLAVVGIAFWFTTARRYQSPAARQISWIFAASQTLAVLVPIVLIIAKWAAITAIGILALIALVFLFIEHKKM